MFMFNDDTYDTLSIPGLVCWCLGCLKSGLCMQDFLIYDRSLFHNRYQIIYHQATRIFTDFVTTGSWHWSIGTQHFYKTIENKESTTASYDVVPRLHPTGVFSTGPMSCVPAGQKDSWRFALRAAQAPASVETIGNLSPNSKHLRGALQLFATLSGVSTEHCGQHWQASAFRWHSGKGLARNPSANWTSAKARGTLIRCLAETWPETEKIETWRDVWLIHTCLSEYIEWYIYI